MNYLGHLLVLPDAGLLTLGNLLGDFFKGRTDLIAHPDLRLGVTLHREIDRFTDAHPIVLQSKARIGDSRRRVSGALVDIFYDHFLAQGLDIDSYRAPLLDHAVHLPDPLRDLPSRMISTRWLGSYASIESIAYILIRMQQRRVRITGLVGAEEELLAHYEEFQEDCRSFFPDLQVFTKDAIHRLRSASLEEPQSVSVAATAWDPPENA